jgi:Flp pilus assembly protein TadG
VELVRMMKRTHRDERGAVAVLVAAFAVMMFGFAALVVDLGAARDARRDSQNASDASALAAGNAMYVRGTHTADVAAAVAAAKEYAAKNYRVPTSAWDACTDPEAFVVPAGSTPCISFRPTLTRPEEVRVRMPMETVRTPFAGALGIKSTEIAVSSFAQAELDLSGRSRCGLCILGSGTTHDLQNGDATVHGADIHFNGNVTISSNGLVATDGAITVEGWAGGPLNNYMPDPSTGAPPIKDPLADVPMPPSFAGLTPKSNPCADGPGFYGAQNLRNNTCNLTPGLYVIAGDSGTTWDLAGNESTRLLGNGVTLYFTCGNSLVPRACNPGESGANLDASGNGFLGITAPSSGPLQGFALIYDRNNNATLRLTGNGSQNASGTIYLPSGSVQMNGNGCSQHYYSLIVTKNLEMNGNPSCLQSTYAVGQNARVPPDDLHLTK